MKRLHSLKAKWLARVGAATVAAAVFAVSTFLVIGADNKPEPAVKTEKKAESKPEKKPEKKKLSGAELYATHCNRCHPERYATERTPTQWKTLMLHMRIRANLPPAQAKAILKYLQEDSGTP
jgi:mono/diheme cytochrome c family protein